MSTFALSFEPNILAVGAEFAAFQAVLDAKLEAAGQAAGMIVQEGAIAHMHWKNPSGELEGSFLIQQESPGTVAVGPQVAYGMRREYGFSGMTDSLGRFYSNDPGEFYMTLTLQDAGVLLDVSALYIAATLEAWAATVGVATGIGALVAEV